MKTQSLDVIKFNQKPDSEGIEKLKREVMSFKSVEQQLKQEILTIQSKLDDEQHKNYRAENLLQLRGEYISTLQDTDEVNKARLVLQAKEVEDLREKINRQKKFKAATNEEVKNLHNTLKSQEFQIQNLQFELKAKNEKLSKYRSKMNSVESQ